MSKSQLKKAIENTEEPTPGYLYQEIARASIEQVSEQKKIIKYLFGKLESFSGVHTAYKTLHLLRVLCELGHADLQKVLQQPQYTQLIEQYGNYRGVPDVHHGDAFNAKIRDEAKLALRAVFAPRVGATAGVGSGEAAGTGAFARDLTGFGSSSCAGTSSGNGGGGADWGIRVPEFAPGSGGGGGSSDMRGRIGEMPAVSRWAEQQQRQQAKGSRGDALAQQLASTAKASLALLYGGGKDDTSEAKARSAFLQRFNDDSRNRGAFQPVSLAAAPEERQNSEAEALWPASGPSEDLAQFSEFIGKPAPSATSAAAAAPSSFGFIGGSGGGGGDSEGKTTGAPTAANEKNSAIRALVQQYAALQSAPQRVELRQLTENVAALTADSSVDAQAISQTLVAVCEESLVLSAPFQRRLNVLSCLEALLLDSDPRLQPLQKAIQQHFQSQPAAIRRNTNVVQQRLKEKALKLQEILQLPEERNESVRPTETTSASPGSAQGSGFDFLFGAPPPPSAPQTPQNDSNNAVAAAPPPLLMEGMTVRSQRRQKKTAPQALFDDDSKQGSAVAAPKRRLPSQGSTAVESNRVGGNGGGGNHAPSSLEDLFGPAPSTAIASAGAAVVSAEDRRAEVKDNSSGTVIDDLFGGPSTTQDKKEDTASLEADYMAAVKIQAELQRMLDAAQKGTQKPDPETLTQLDQLMRQQQSLLYRIQAQERRQQQKSSGDDDQGGDVYYNFPSYGMGGGGDSGDGGDNATHVKNSHTHFVSGAASNAQSEQSAKAREKRQLAEVQAEMMQSLKKDVV